MSFLGALIRKVKPVQKLVKLLLAIFKTPDNIPFERGQGPNIGGPK